MTTHSLRGHHWTGQEGYFVECTCGAEICVGPDNDYNVPQPARLAELQNKEPDWTTEDDTEYAELRQEWQAKQNAKFAELYRRIQGRMRKAIADHATQVSKQ